LTEDDLEEITKECSVDLLVPTNPAEMSDVDSLETTTDAPGPRKTKKNEEAQDVHGTLVKISSISPEKGGYGREIDGIEVE
jgi:hypothetical protein